MRALLILNFHDLSGKYWLIPTLMALGAIALAFALVALDRYLGAKWVDEVPWLYANGPTGARSLLSTIAGSMITVAGVTFSITTVAIATTASTFGPRLISNLMQDRGSQVTLGTFIATFLYCILVLRTVRGADGSDVAFVPHLAVAGALLFALASLGVLIYFMHHVPESIHISNLVAGLGRDLIGQIERLFPETLDEPEGSGASASGGPPGAGPPGTGVPAGSEGYVRYIDHDGLVKHAAEHDLFVTLRCRPGDFVSASDELATVQAGDLPGDEVLEAIRAAIVVGPHQSQRQDVLYSIDRLVEVAGRALSPGVNDLFTATNAIDWLRGSLVSLVHRRLPDGAHRDEEGRVRVTSRPWSFAEIAGSVFDQLRPYVARDRNAALHMMRALALVARETEDRGRRTVLRAHVDALRETVDHLMDDPGARDALASAHAEAVNAFSGAGRR